MTDAEYVSLGGTHCPHCRSTQIEAPGSCEVDAGTASQLMVCHNCDGEWTDQYKLTGYHLESPRRDRH
jgi:transposase-like protein